MTLSRKSTLSKLRAGLGLCAVTVAAAVLGLACKSEDKTFRQAACGTDQAKWCAPRTFAGGLTVDAATLNAGHDSYMLYCYACHGEDGDGRGPSSYGLRPPPRNFKLGIFKFARLRSSDELPTDDDLYRIVSGGLHGTAMLQWDIPENELRYILQYIKTFAPAKWEKKKKSGEMVKTLDPFELPNDPWAGKVDEAVARGFELYHLKAECLNCHPAYGTKEELYKLSVAAEKREPAIFKALTGFRDDPFGSVAKDSTEYGVHMTVPVDAPKAEAKHDHKPGEKHEGKHEGAAKEPTTKEVVVPVRIFPPDFTFTPLRSVHPETQMEDLFRVLSYGVYPIMPAWKGALEDKDIWAIAHYLKSLTDMRDKPAAAKLREKLDADRNVKFEIPKPPEPAGDATAPDEKKDGDAAPAGDKKDEKKDTKGAETKGAETKGAETKGAETKGTEKKGAEPKGAEPKGGVKAEEKKVETKSQ